MENIEKLPSIVAHNRPQTELGERLSLRTLSDCSTAMLCTLQIYAVGTGTPVNKCKSYKYLPYTLQCRSLDVTVNHCTVMRFDNFCSTGGWRSPC